MPERVKDGRALAEVRRLVDGKRACATFMFGFWPARQADYMLRTDSVNTLVSAGIITVRPDGIYDGLPALRIEPTARGARYFRMTPPPKNAWSSSGEQGSMYLCYGKLQVVSIHLIHDELRSDYSLEYGVRVVDLAPWALRPDVRRAFPFLVRTEGKTFVSHIAVTREHYFGPLELSSDPEEETPVDDPQATFASCSFTAGDRMPQCD